jgi:hypothetical protein
MDKIHPAALVCAVPFVAAGLTIVKCLVSDLMRKSRITGSPRKR